MYFNKYKGERKMKLTNPKSLNNFSEKSNSLNKQNQKKPKCSPIQLGNNDYIFNIALNNLNKYNDAILSKQGQSFSIDENNIKETKELDKIIGNQSPILKKENNISNLNNDNKLIYTLKILDLENLFNEFNLNYITFHDLFLLTRDDLLEMNIPIGPRNRILNFCIEFKKYAKNYDYNDLINFFKSNKGFVFNENEEIENNINNNNNDNYNSNENNNNNDINNIIYEEKIPNQKTSINYFNKNNNDINSNKDYYSFNYNQQNNNSLANNISNESYRNNISSPKLNNKIIKIIKEKQNNEIPIPIKSAHQTPKNIQLNSNDISYIKKVDSFMNMNNKLDNENSFNENINEYSINKKNDIYNNNNNNFLNDSSEFQENFKYNSVDNTARKKTNARNNKNHNKYESNNKYINKSFNSKHSTTNRTNSIQSNNSMSNINNSKINSQIVQNFENIFSEVENFQNQYMKMKEKSNERNNKINCLLNKKNNEIENIKNHLIGKNNNNEIKINKKELFIRKNNNNNIILDNNDLENETERNLNEELGKIYNESNMKNISYYFSDK